MKKELEDTLKSTLRIMEDNLAMVANPETARPQLIYDICLQRRRITTEDDLKPQDYLDSLVELEEWYRNYHVSYPFPERLKDQKEYWKSRTNLNG